MEIGTRSARIGVTLTFILLGGAVGAAIGMLMAPDSGAETRRKIAGKMKEGAESVGSGVKSVQEQLSKTGGKIGSSSRLLFSKGRSVFSREGRDVVSEAIDAAKQAYLEEKDAWMLRRQ